MLNLGFREVLSLDITKKAERIEVPEGDKYSSRGLGKQALRAFPTPGTLKQRGGDPEGVELATQTATPFRVENPSTAQPGA